MAIRSTDSPRAPRPTAPAREPAPEGRGERQPEIAWPRLVEGLRAELGGTSWDYPWELAPALRAPCSGRSARRQAWTLERMIEEPARDALAVSTRPRGLDLACGEGRLAGRLLVWGAARVVGIETRELQRRRAQLLREQLAIGEARLELRAGLADLDLGDGFDVVLLLGADPELGAGSELLASAAEATRGICAIETLAARTSPVAEAAIAAGFGSAELVGPPLHADPAYLLEERELLIARPRARA